MNSRKAGSSVLLLVVAMIWGVAFVAQSVGADYVGPFTFTAVRYAVGSIVLLPVIAVMGRGKKKELSQTDKKTGRKTLVLGGVLCGICLCGGSCLQQIAIQYTAVGKASFITALYIILVPVVSILFKKKAGVLVWISVVVALVGMYFLCIKDGFSINIGDWLTFIGSLCFTAHILVIDHFTQKVDGVKMSCIQFLTCAVLSAILMVIFETPSLGSIAQAWLPIAYAGVMSSGVAYTLQIVAQKNVDPTVASLIMSLESVIGALAGWILLDQNLSGREVFGCALVFCGIILAQLPPDIFRKRRSVK